MSALDIQEDGSHYKDLPIQPIEYIHANNIPFPEGTVIKYVTRWRNKGGIKDLRKARHVIDLLIELEERKAKRESPVLTEAAAPDEANTPTAEPAAEHPTCLVCGKAHPGAMTSFFVELETDDLDQLEAELETAAKSESPAAAHFRRVIESQILAEVFRNARAQPKRAAGR